MYLFINTQNNEYIELAVVDDQGSIIMENKISARYEQSEKLLDEIEKIMKKGKTEFSGLKGVIVVTGPGGFTSLRIGVTTANTLAWILQIPIVGIKSENKDLGEVVKEGYKKIKNKKSFKQVLPEYGREPNITVKKIKMKSEKCVI